MLYVRRDDIPSLRDLLPKLLGKLARDTQDAKALLPLWPQIVGEQAAKHARPGSLRDGTLEIFVYGPGWASALTARQEDILHRLRSHVDGRLVQRLTFLQR